MAMGMVMSQSRSLDYIPNYESQRVGFHDHDDHQSKHNIVDQVSDGDQKAIAFDDQSNIPNIQQPQFIDFLGVGAT